jgi:hypothetical protein
VLCASHITAQDNNCVPLCSTSSTLQAIPLLKDAIKKAYGKKGDKVVQQNWAAVDHAMAALKKIEVPAEWAEVAPRDKVGAANTMAAATPKAAKAAAAGPTAFLEQVVQPMLAMEGDKLPVRCAAGGAGGWGGGSCFFNQYCATLDVHLQRLPSHKQPHAHLCLHICHTRPVVAAFC